MMSSVSGEPDRVAAYFDRNARDFDSIYEHDKRWVRRIRDRLSRGTVTARLDFCEDLVDRVRPSRVLDVGCGSGRIGTALALRGVEVVGIDFAGEMIELARRRADAMGVSSRCTFVHGDYLEGVVGGQFDVGLAIGVFDYVKDPEDLLGRLAGDSEGQLVASFPKRLHVLAPLRWLRLHLSGCPLHLYTRREISSLGAAHLGSHRVLSFRRDWLLVGGDR